MKIKLNDKVSIDLDKLVESRLLVQANSGGGKSWAIRRIIEQAFGHVQIIVIDPEGEFGNMRKEFDFVYAGKDGDAPAEPRSATLLARRLLELKASAVIDLYELPPKDRKHFVRLFCESLVNAPKELWHDVLVIIDEAHVFAPEKDESEALGAVIDLASRGRKRGYCAILATQRPAKLNKDAAAECNNKLIGRASLDIDRKRAAEELGLTTKESVLSLRDLDPGEFYVFGPAISREVIKAEIGDVKVKPPKRGVAKQSVPAPSATVKNLLAKLADLPAEAQKEAQTVNELKAALAVTQKQLKDLTRLPSIQPVYDSAREKQAVESALKKFKDTLYQKLLKSHGNVSRALEAMAKDIDTLKQEEMPVTAPRYTSADQLPARSMFKDLNTNLGDDIQKVYKDYDDSNKPLSKGALSILTYLQSVYPKTRTKTQLWVATTYAPGGGFNNYIYELTGAGLIDKSADGHYRALQTTDSPYFPSLNNWDSKLSLGARKIFHILLDNYNDTYDKERLANETGYAMGGGFNNYIYELTGKELVVKVGTEYKINPEILDL